MSLDKVTKVTKLEDCKVILDDECCIVSIEIHGKDIRLWSGLNATWVRMKVSCSKDVYQKVNVAFKHGRDHINAGIFGCIIYYENFMPYGHWHMDGLPGDTTEWDNTVKELLRRLFPLF
jgi:hypothetical protein